MSVIKKIICLEDKEGVLHMYNLDNIKKIMLLELEHEGLYMSFKILSSGYPDDLILNES
jgi:hypothetical protein